MARVRGVATRLTVVVLVFAATGVGTGAVVDTAGAGGVSAVDAQGDSGPGPADGSGPAERRRPPTRAGRPAAVDTRDREPKSGSARGTGGTQSEGVNLTVYAAPGSAASVETYAGVVAYRRAGNLTRRARVTRADTLVVRVEASGFAAAVDAVDESVGNTTARVRAALAGDRVELTAGEFRSDPGRSPKALALTDPGSLTAVEGGEDTYYLLYDVGALPATLDANRNDRADDEEAATPRSGEVYRLTLTVAEQSAETVVGLFPATAVIRAEAADNRTVVVPAPGQAIEGRAFLAPGTRLTVTAVGRDGASFRRRATAVVQPGDPGRFSADLDFGGVAPGAEFDLVVSHDARTLTTGDGRVTTLEASLSTPARSSSSESVPVERLSLSNDGLLVVRAGGPEGPVVGSRFFPAGTYTDVSVPLARAVSGRVAVVAYVDVDGDGLLDLFGPDRPYRSGGSPVSGTVTLPGTGSTPTATPTATATPTPTATATATPDRTTQLVTPPPTRTRPPRNRDTVEDTRGGVTTAVGPGFGPVSAVGSLAALAVLRGRRLRGRERG